MSTDTHTIRLHRVLRCPPERLYRAFLDPHALAKWLAPNGFTNQVHHLEPRVGGTYRMTFTNFSSEGGHSFGGTFLELVPGRRIRHTDAFEGGPAGEMETTVELREVSLGTELSIEQAGVPGAIPPEACTLGWQESLRLLALLVEAEIPDESGGPRE